MSLKDTARTLAVLSTLHDAIGEQVKPAKKELEAGLKAAKAETGTQKISVSLDDGREVGSVTLVQPKPAAAVTDPDAFAAWVVSFGDRFKDEVERKFVTSVKPGFQKKLLAEITAAGVAEWADPETGVIHEVPGVTMQGRAAYTRLTVPDEGKAAIAEAWRTGTLVLPGVSGPAAVEAGGEDVEKLRARVAELEERDAWLSALEAAGVDNWEGYDNARGLRRGGDDA
jgi:outer membrane murein-binding lipoprotein Lpp